MWNQPSRQLFGPRWGELPGICYKLIGAFLNERLPLIIFTSRSAFKLSLQYQISEYEDCRQQAFEMIKEVK
jgi:hypothetical protein